MKLGLSTYSLYQALNSGKMTVEDVIDFTADHGGEHVEIVPLGYNLTEQPELIDTIVSKAAARGLEISNYAIGANFLLNDQDAYEQEIARVQREVDIAHRLGVKLMRHDVASSPDVSIANFNAHLEQLANACRRIAEYAASYGITTSVENHGFFIQQSDRVQALIHAVGLPNFKTTLDIGNFLCADEQPIAAVKNNLPYASIVHIKDFYVRPAGQYPGEGFFTSTAGQYLRGAVAGQGDLPMRDIIKMIKSSGYDGYLSLEFEGLEDCELGSRAGLANVRRIWDEV
ncbi:sugar phosphate isomerase/epimerase [Paenibacillus urinalis]|uniref:Sugar phosphate isomerase/epimerase n=1 Tax=Paenibacillus urinalis TaxID=521520 RepID=A0AAX3N4R3_9BACL|nr:MULTISPECIES: sugar phosphate isomerase/epimerase family protein [Paenibacillus]WDH83684.1 sugar phosphate isomerase/epimerase [Paenibacillus urinalis]WDH99714.1 sugar phosphate isomerase/epimerase [Paenibacillus urinalis]WDI03346.1 sugar phosphate isomerase/epimerase [Paenibacillus urinalis]GAK41217.1 putative xylose isomerase [Paenibacillus sp. TCA20]